MQNFYHILGSKEFRLIIPCLLLAAHALQAETACFPIEDLRPGMRGLTYTVLQGDKIEPLQTEIMGVAKNYAGPGLDLIIAKLVDPKTELTGAVHGMSGSPLYIDGKLVGALSRGLVGFIKDGQCGFTPIRDMLNVAKMAAENPAPSVPPFTISTASLMDQFHQVKDLVEETYLSIPLAVSGLPVEVTDQLLEKYGLKACGMAAVSGGGTSLSDHAGSESLVPGAPLSVILMSGDISAAGTGTLTWRDQDKVLGFGHPMFGTGLSNWPMGTAEIITTIPSYDYPHKMANQGGIVGTVQQDRASAIYGQIGSLPPLASYRIEQTHNGVSQKTLKGQFVSDPMITPMLVASAIMQSLVSGGHLSREFSMEMKGELTFSGLPALKMEGLFSGEEEDLISAVIDQLQSVSMVMRQEWSKPQVTGLELALNTTEIQHVWHIEGLELERTKLEPGKKVEVTVELQQRYGERRQERFEVPLPEGLKEGSVMVRVAGAQTLDQQGFFQELQAIKEPAQLIDRLNHKRARNGLYLQLVTHSHGQIIAQYELPSLPDSVRSVMEPPDKSKGSIPLTERVWLETFHLFGGVVDGEEQVNLEIR